MRMLLMCLFASVCFLKGSEACEYREYRVACVGDSITTGNYPKVLEGLLGDNAEVKVYAREGLGVSGVSISELYEALGRWNPTHVVFYAGINDCMMGSISYDMEGGDARNSSWVIGQLDQVILKIQYTNAKAIIVKHHPWGGYKKGSYGCSVRVNEWLDGEIFNYESATVVETISLGDPSERLKKEYDAGDGLHLNYEGDKLLARLVADAIR